MRTKLLFSCLLFSFHFVSAQVVTVRGKVTSGETALSSVTIQVKGTKTATQTDKNGDYSISVSANASLIFTSVGYADREVKINNQTSINVQLEPSARQLNEVVVVGYGTQKRKDVTGAVVSINAATIAKVPVVTAEQALQGRAARCSNNKQ